MLKIFLFLRLVGVELFKDGIGVVLFNRVYGFLKFFKFQFRYGNLVIYDEEVKEKKVKYFDIKFNFGDIVFLGFFMGYNIFIE